jgi:hypothetical protein
MIYLYMDKFRGFSETVIPLESVNFLVGENSTGKTSVLALVNLLSSGQFWMQGDFNLPEYEFGAYRDIRSVNVSGDEEFCFGLYRDAAKAGGAAVERDMFLAFYNEGRSLPVLSFFSWLYGYTLLNVRREKAGYSYCRVNLERDDVPSNPRKLFRWLAAQRLSGGTGYKALAAGFPPGAGPLPIWFAFATMRGKEGFVGGGAPILTPDLVWFAPIRTKARRTYDGYGRPFDPEGGHTPYLLRKRLLSRKHAQPFRAALEALGKASGLFNEVVIKKLGDDPTSPFELLVKLASKSPLRINSVGYGVSQSLPLIAELLARPKGSWFAIQQPEVHLHPRAQAALGGLIYQMAERDGKNFLVETHSDFTIDRFRMSFRDNRKHKTTGQVLFFEATENGNKVTPLRFGPNGEYPEQQPPAFRDFFVKEQLSLLGI